MAKNTFNLKYDPKTDILHLSFGRAQQAISVEQEPEVFYRVNPKTNKLVGLTVLGFQKSFLAKKQELKFPILPLTN